MYHVSADLLQAERTRIAPRVVAVVPARHHVQGRVDWPARAPPEEAGCLPGLEPELLRFRRTDLRIMDPGHRDSPMLGEQLDEIGDWSAVPVGWPKVPFTRERQRVASQMLGQAEVAVQTVKHVLPRPDRFRVAQDHRVPSQEGLDRLWNELVRCPVAAPYDVSSAGTGKAHAVPTVVLHRKEGVPIGLTDQLGTRLTIGIRIVTTEAITLAIAPHPSAILVALVGGDVHDRAPPVRAAN